MGLVKTEKGIIEERRKTNGRIKLDLGDWIKIATVIIALILTGGKMQFTLNNHSEILAKQDKELKDTVKMTNDNRKDIEGIKDTLCEIKKDVKELLKRK